jgi:MazG family protein
MNEMNELLKVMVALRTPGTGCPWDLSQNFYTLVPYTIEEAYEVADAIFQGDPEELKKELGDLLFQVVFYAQIAQEEGVFTFADVVAAITEKMIRRHPHVFGDTQSVDRGDPAAVWEEIKAQERGKQADSVLDHIPETAPAMIRAVKLQRKAARVGFDWPHALEVLAKVAEELEEVRAEVEAGADGSRLTDELGDLLFACVNLARHLQVDPDSALRVANGKFERRFRRIEAWLAASGRSPSQARPAELEALWERAKAEE